MTEAPLHLLVVSLLHQPAEDVTDWVSKSLDCTPVEMADTEGRTTALHIYFDSAIEAQLAGAAIEQSWQISQWSVQRCPREDWAESWKQHFQPMPIGKNLWVCPPWHDGPPPHPGMTTVVINPGLSFGTGQHFTTRFCLAELVAALKMFPGASLLDAGTGSGILSVTALKLGASGVVAVDNDPQCMDQVQHNLDLNGLAGKIIPQVMDVTVDPLPGPFDLVFANIYDPLLIGIASRLLPCVRHRLVLSGIRSPEVDRVADAYTGLGAVELRRAADSEWAGLVLVPPA